MSSNQKSYRKTPDDVEYYELDSDGNENYFSHNNIQIYAFNFPGKEEIYATSGGIPYYAKNNHKEIYAVDLKRDGEKFINIDGTDKYARNGYNVEFYPRDLVGRDKVAKTNTAYFYARGGNQDFYYPTDEYSNEFIIQDLMITLRNGELITPKRRDGSVNYIKMGETEIPYKCNNIYFVGKNAIGIGQYPLDGLGISYYPDNNSDPKFATDAYYNYMYALDKQNSLIYPQISNEETYIKNEAGSYTILKRHARHFKRYAQHNQLYPINISENGQISERLINDMYAEKNNKMIYPKDCFKNEYLNLSGELLDAYPVTSDGSLIIPNVNNKPLVKPIDNLLIKEIKCLLFRPDFKRYDFLLKCLPNTNHLVLHSESFSTPFINLRYVIVLLGTTVCILLFILIVFKK